MNRYALHFGYNGTSLVRARDEVAEVVDRYASTSHYWHEDLRNVETHVDGDQFLAWGEDCVEGDTPHVVVYYDAPDDWTAVRLGHAQFWTLRDHGVIDTLATCVAGQPVPVAITSAHVWSAQLDHNGNRIGAADWEEHDSHYAAA